MGPILTVYFRNPDGNLVEISKRLQRHPKGKAPVASTFVGLRDFAAAPRDGMVHCLDPAARDTALLCFCCAYVRQDRAEADP
jgi:hypothetical protein